MNGNKNKIIVSKNEFYIRKTCRICNSKRLFKFLSLGYTPLANSFLKEKDLNKPEKYYPLDVCFCEECYLTQLQQVVYPEFLFKHYLYTTGTSAPMRKHFRNLAIDITRKFSFSKNDLIVDIGSNDGILLNNFLSLGFSVLGVEPAANIAEISRRKGIETVNKFFDKYTAMEIVDKFGQAKIITATNVFAHIDNLDNFVEGVNILLDKNGIFVIEVPYALQFLRNIEFDTIYHEHLSYFAVHPLVTLFRRFNMYISDINTLSVHGGSLCVFVRKGDGFLSENTRYLLRQENKSAMSNATAYIDFAKKVERIKERTVEILNKVKQGGYNICGYGATAKSTTFLNYCNIGCNFIEFIVDTTPLKQGLFTPGMHIPIYSMEKFHNRYSNYALLLAWNYAQDILQKEKNFLESGGKFILPIPKPKII